MDADTEIGPALTSVHRDNVQRCIEQLLRDGATLIATDPPGSAPTFSKGSFFVRPTIVGEVTPAMRFPDGDLFAPLVCLSRFSTTEELIEILQEPPLTACLYVWTSDRSVAAHITHSLSVEYAWVGNDVPSTSDCSHDEYEETRTYVSGLNPEQFTRLKLVHRDLTSEFARKREALVCN